MNNEKYKLFLCSFIFILKKKALKAKIDAENSVEENESYQIGHVMAYAMVISLMKIEAGVFEIEENVIGLADIDSDVDLLIQKKDSC